MPFDSLIFDLDGTLWDTSAPVSRAWNLALKALGDPKRSFSPEDIGSIMGMPEEQILEKFFPDEKKDRQQEIAKECYKHEEKVIRREGGVLYPGVEEGLKELAARFPLFIVSNCQENYIETFLEVTSLGRFFKDHECHGATGLSKGENITLVIKRNGLQQPAYIGDTSSDQEAALYAQTPYFHVNYGFGRPSRKCETFDTFADVVARFLPRP